MSYTILPSAKKKKPTVFRSTVFASRSWKNHPTYYISIPQPLVDQVCEVLKWNKLIWIINSVVGQYFHCLNFALRIACREFCWVTMDMLSDADLHLKQKFYVYLWVWDMLKKLSRVDNVVSIFHCFVTDKVNLKRTVCDTA